MFLDQYLCTHKEIVLDFISCFCIDLCEHTRRFWLTLFFASGSIFVVTGGDHDCLSFLFLDWCSWAHKEIVIEFLFCFWINLRLVMLLPDFPLLTHVTGMSSLLQRFGWDNQSRFSLVLVRYRCTIITLSSRWWSLCLTYIAKSFSCRFPVELRSCFSTVPCEWLVW